MTRLGLTFALAMAGAEVQAGTTVLPQHLIPDAVQVEWVAPAPVAVPYSTNCTPAVLLGAATMVASAGVFFRGWVEDDSGWKTGGVIGETLGSAILIFGVSRPSCR